jgi:hypothetical protein
MVLDLCDAGSFTHNQGGHFCWKSHVSNDQAKKCFFFRGFCLGYWDGSYRGTMSDARAIFPRRASLGTEQCTVQPAPAAPPKDRAIYRAKLLLKFLGPDQYTGQSSFTAYQNTSVLPGEVSVMPNNSLLGNLLPSSLGKFLGPVI